MTKYFRNKSKEPQTVFGFGEIKPGQLLKIEDEESAAQFSNPNFVETDAPKETKKKTSKKSAGPDVDDAPEVPDPETDAPDEQAEPGDK